MQSPADTNVGVVIDSPEQTQPCEQDRDRAGVKGTWMDMHTITEGRKGEVHTVATTSSRPSNFQGFSVSIPTYQSQQSQVREHFFTVTV
jgi:hypothetical protein